MSFLSKLTFFFLGGGIFAVAFAARTELGDPAYIKNDKKLKEIMSKSYAAQVRANISDVSVCFSFFATRKLTPFFFRLFQMGQDQTYTLEHYNPHFDSIKEDHGTTHLSVIDKYGSAVSLTSTVNL